MTTIDNPIVLQRADPWVLRTEAGYLFTASHPAYDRVVLRRAATLEALQAAPERTIWTPPATGPMSHLVWAPEIHRLDGAWYVYLAAAPTDLPRADVAGANETFDHRIFALVCEDEDPMTGAWADAGRVDTGWDSFSLDATSFVHRGQQYLVWAQQDLTVRGHSNIYIARMRDPVTLASAAVELTRPDRAWEQRGFWVNEGPAVLVAGSTVTLTYSGAATGVDYAVGMLTASVDADLLDPGSWRKHDEPVLRSHPATSQYGPGHNCFTTTPQGEHVLVYHARNSPAVVGDPLRDPNRHARAQLLEVDGEGRAVWSPPVADVRPTPDGLTILRPEGLG